jgi:hypothetical protein
MKTEKTTKRQNDKTQNDKTTKRKTTKRQNVKTKLKILNQLNQGNNERYVYKF